MYYSYYPSNYVIFLNDHDKELYLALLKKAGCSEDVIAHSIAVSSLAEEIGVKLLSKGIDLDIELIIKGALLHDVGRAVTHDVTHVIEGVKLAENFSLEPEVIGIIKTHVGAGITFKEARQLGFPLGTYVPQTIEQKIVAHADNLVKGNKRISLQTRIEHMKKENMSDYIIKRIVRLASEIENY